MKRRLTALLLVTLVAALTIPAARPEPAQALPAPTEPVGVTLAAGSTHTCVIDDTGALTCWGAAYNGRLGYGDASHIGDNETPGDRTVDLAGRTATAIATGAAHTCALLDTGTVTCWGYGGDGRLGYGDTTPIGDNETPGNRTVDLTGRTATAITTGSDHTCALLDTGDVTCWGYGGDGRLGYGDTDDIGDDETPGARTVDLAGRSAVAVSGGDKHTCALLDTGDVTCWGYGGAGRLGYGDTITIGDSETPGARTVDLTGRTATAITAGTTHTCALLDTGDVTCWGRSNYGQLGLRRRDLGSATTRPPATAPSTSPAAPPPPSPPARFTPAPSSTPATSPAGARGSPAGSATATPTTSATTRPPATAPSTQPAAPPPPSPPAPHTPAPSSTPAPSPAGVTA